MKHTIHILMLLVACTIQAQTLSLQDVITRAQEQSAEARSARHAYTAAYWSWRAYKASLLPSASLTSNPNLNRTISSVTLPDGTDSYVERNQLMVDAGVEINQALPLTGGNFFVSSTLQRLDIFSENRTTYKSIPIVVGYQQNLFDVNTYKWNKRTEPLRYQEASKTLVETLELVAAKATQHFFQLATAQTDYEIAVYNEANADTLFRYAKGRYEIGTITENEMLQLELNLLQEQTNRMNALINVEDCRQMLRSYLAMGDESEISVRIDDKVASFIVNEDRALRYAIENNPEIETQRLQRIESDKAVASARANRGFRADLFMQFGLTQTADALSNTYNNPLDQQLVQIGIRIPILDWGVGKGNVKVAQSNRERVYTETEQLRTDFEHNVLKVVRQFNLQADKVKLAKRVTQTAERRHNVARRLYILGKSSILDLNAAIAEKDAAKRSYISSLYSYWNYYYAIRSFTAYDFAKEKPIANQ